MDGRTRMVIRAEKLSGRQAKKKAYPSRGECCSLKKRIHRGYSSLTVLSVLFFFLLICTVPPVAKALAIDENCIDNASESCASVEQGDSKKAEIAANASEKLQKAKELVEQGRLDEGIPLAEEAAKLDPGNAEADESVQKWKKDLSEITSHISRAKSLIGLNQFQEAKTEIDTVKKRHPNYQALLETERLLNDKMATKREEIQKKMEESAKQWRARDKKNFNLQGMEKSQGRPNLQPAPALKNQIVIPKMVFKKSEETVSKPVGEPLSAPLPGRIWHVKELWWGRALFEGVWTRRGDSEVFDAEWRYLADGHTIRDTLRDIRIEGDQINIHRDGTNGEYKGRLSPDGRHIEGTATWYSPYWSWTAEIEP